MKTGRSTVIVSAAVSMMLLIAGFFLFHWPAWLSLIVAGFVPVLAILVLRRPPDPPLPEPVVTYVPVPPVEPRHEQIADVLLPSMHEDYYFVLSATVLWKPTVSDEDDAVVSPTALAVDSVLKRCRHITEQRDPGNVSLVRYELASALSQMQADDTGRLQAMAESIQLVLPDHDQERLNKLATVRKDEAVWEHERKYEQSRRHYLSADVLKDPGSTVVWWLAKNDDQVEKTVQGIGQLARLFAAANNTDLPEAFRRLVPELASMYTPGIPPYGAAGLDESAARAEKSAADYLEAFLQAVDLSDGDPERVLFARRVADVVAAHGQQEVADEIVGRFDTSDDVPEPPEAGDEY